MVLTSLGLGTVPTHLKRSAVMSGTGIHRLIYRDICVERGTSYAACCSQHTPPMDVPMNDPDTCTSYHQRSQWTRCRQVLGHPRSHARMLIDSCVLPGSYSYSYLGHPDVDVSIQGAATTSKTGGGNVTDRESTHVLWVHDWGQYPLI